MNRERLGTRGGPTLDTVIALKSDELQRILKGVERGDRAFQQTQPRARDRQLGSTR